MKKNVGIGYLKLLIWIFIILAVIVVSVFYIRKEIKKEEVKNFQADMLLVQAKVELIKGKNNVDKENNPLKGIKLTRIT